MKKKKVDPRCFLDKADLRDIPAYSIADAAHYLLIPATTIRAWVAGRPYRTNEGHRRFEPVIALPERNTLLLSFYNLAEAHVLRALRAKYGIKLRDIRLALEYVEQKLGTKRPLLAQNFKTDGVSLFVERFGHLVDATAHGQIVMREVMEAHLERLEWENKVVARLYPFTRSDYRAAPRSVFIDPRFSFGRPILRDSRIATAVIAQRYKAGDSIDDLATDYGCDRSEIEEAVRCELRLPTAA